jgi:hypothetical protein
MKNNNLNRRHEIPPYDVGGKIRFATLAQFNVVKLGQVLTKYPRSYCH